MRKQLEGIAPTPRQLAYLRALASQGNATFAEPVTRKQAAKQIARLKLKRRRQRGDLQAPNGSTPALAATSWRPAWVERRHLS